MAAPAPPMHANARSRGVHTWTHAQVHSALRQLNPFHIQIAVCQAPPTPYRTVQDMIFSSQEQLQVTVGASVAEARAQLLSLQTQLRTQLYASYLEQCMQVSPEFRERGRRIGDRIISQLRQQATAAQVDQGLRRVKYRDAAVPAVHDGLAAQVQPGRWLAPGCDGCDAACEYDTALAVLDGLASPFLEPFVDGLKEPFMRAVDEYRAQLQSTMIFTSVGSLAAGAVAGLAIGFLVGRFAGRGSGSGECK